MKRRESDKCVLHGTTALYGVAPDPVSYAFEIETKTKTRNPTKNATCEGFTAGFHFLKEPGFPNQTLSNQ
jgi:hypothetical protein